MKPEINKEGDGPDFNVGKITTNTVLHVPPGSGNAYIKTFPLPPQVKPLDEDTFEDVYGNLTKENRYFVLLAIGFKPRGLARWYHPCLGEDLECNHLLFDLETDELASLIPKLYRSGYVQGQRNIRFKFKEILDL